MIQCDSTSGEVYVVRGHVIYRVLLLLLFYLSLECMAIVSVAMIHAQFGDHSTARLRARLAGFFSRNIIIIKIKCPYGTKKVI